MTYYSTIDYLPDLADSYINSARYLDFSLATDNSVGWDNESIFYTTQDYALLDSTFVFNGQEGATYDIFSHSFYDPFILLLYDNYGNVIATDQDQGTYGSDMIFDFFAPYSGEYYVSASWDQGYADINKFVAVSVYENIDTIQPPPPPPPPLLPPPELKDDRDRVFDWGESAYSYLFPTHNESQDAFGYYARLYSNGDALGEKDGNIYYYDGGSDGTGEIISVGGVSDFLSQAVAAGF